MFQYPMIAVYQESILASAGSIENTTDSKRQVLQARLNEERHELGTERALRSSLEDPSGGQEMIRGKCCSLCHGYCPAGALPYSFVLSAAGVPVNKM